MTTNIETLLALVDKVAADAEERASVTKILRSTEETDVAKELLEEEEEGPLYALIKEMSVGQKIKLAAFGNQTARTILIRDPNKLVSLFVLQNARITDNEIVEFARNKDLDEAVLREIAGNGSWMKLYSVKLAIVANPRVPAPLAIKWLGHVHERDLRRLARSKEIPQVVATQANRLLARKK